MKIIDAPPDLARLVAAHLACPPGREWGQTLIRIQEWIYANHVRMYTVFAVEEVLVTCSDSLPRIGRRPGKNGQLSRRGADDDGDEAS